MMEMEGDEMDMQDSSFDLDKYLGTTSEGDFDNVENPTAVLTELFNRHLSQEGSPDPGFDATTVEDPSEPAQSADLVNRLDQLQLDGSNENQGLENPLLISDFDPEFNQVIKHQVDAPQPQLPVNINTQAFPEHLEHPEYSDLIFDLEFGQIVNQPAQVASVLDCEFTPTQTLMNLDNHSEYYAQVGAALDSIPTQTFTPMNMDNHYDLIRIQPENTPGMMTIASPQGFLDPMPNFQLPTTSGSGSGFDAAPVQAQAPKKRGTRAPKPKKEGVRGGRVSKRARKAKDKETREWDYEKEEVTPTKKIRNAKTAKKTRERNKEKLKRVDHLEQENLTLRQQLAQANAELEVERAKTSLIQLVLAPGGEGQGVGVGVGIQPGVEMQIPLSLQQMPTPMPMQPPVPMTMRMTLPEDQDQNPDPTPTPTPTIQILWDPENPTQSNPELN